MNVAKLKIVKISKTVVSDFVLDALKPIIEELNEVLVA